MPTLKAEAMTNTKQATALRDETRELLINRPASLPIATIAADLDISEAWLNTFRRGKIENPGVVTICALNAYLKNHNKKG